MPIRNPVAEGISEALAPLPTVAPRNLDVFVNRAELAHAASAPLQKVYRAFADGALTPDATDSHGHPLFLLCRLPALKSALDKSNAPVL